MLLIVLIRKFKDIVRNTDCRAVAMGPVPEGNAVENGKKEKN